MASNYRAVRKLVGPNVKIMAVVKADAYGHGAVECSRTLVDEGTDWLGVALPEEGVELREAGVQAPILCMGGFWPGQERLCLHFNLTPVVYRLDMCEAIDRAARDRGVIADVHLKVDTGMGRLGVRYDEANEFLDSLRNFEHIRLDGLMTHFAAADDPDQECFTSDQVNRFQNVARSLRERGFNPTYEDLANSAATFASQDSWGNMIRPGGVLYGLWRDILPPNVEAGPFRPAMALRSRVALLKWVPRGDLLGYGCTFEASRRTRVATVPVGYHDGYVRGVSNRGRVILRGTLVPVVGRISMDLTILDVTDVPEVEVGDHVTLLGEDNGLSVQAEEIAKTAGTLSYEITCGISRRVPKVYVRDSNAVPPS